MYINVSCREHSKRPGYGWANEFSSPIQPLHCWGVRCGEYNKAERQPWGPVKWQLFHGAVLSWEDADKCNIPWWHTNVDVLELLAASLSWHGLRFYATAFCKTVGTGRKIYKTYLSYCPTPISPQQMTMQTGNWLFCKMARSDADRTAVFVWFQFC